MQKKIGKWDLSLHDEEIGTMAVIPILDNVLVNQPYCMLKYCVCYEKLIIDRSCIYVPLEPSELELIT